MKHEEVVQMRFISNLIKKYKSATPKQLVLSGVFMLAFAAAIGAGFAAKGVSSAAPAPWRSTNSVNSIDNGNYNGGIGALTCDELIKDARNNKPGDLQQIYAHFGLGSGDYDRFVSECKIGTAKVNGDVLDDKGNVVMKNAWSVGRTKFGYSTEYMTTSVGKIYKSQHGVTTIIQNDFPVMILFDKDGTAQFVVMHACGNPVGGDKVPSGAECKGIIADEVEKNVYQLSAKEAVVSGHAKVVKYNYYVDGKYFDSTTSASAKTKKLTLSKTSTVEVKVEISLPGGKTKEVPAAICKKVIEVKKEEKFEYVCKALYATTKDNMNFRFTVKAKHSDNVKLLSADFTADGSTTKNVTAKDSDGNFYKEYTFKDGKSHTVTAVVNVEFTKDGKKQTDKTKVTDACKEKVTSKKPPVCKHNPKLPPNDPKCKPPVKECKPGIPVGDERCNPPKECKPGIPVGDERCNPPKECKPGIPEGDERCETCEDNPGKEGCELPNTGPAGVAALFAGVTAAGTIGHRLFVSRRR